MRRWGIAYRLAEASPFGIDYPTHMIYVTRLSGYELARINNGLNASPERDDRYPEHAQWIPQYKRSEEHTSELQSLMRITYAVFCLKQTTRSSKYQLSTT